MFGITLKKIYIYYLEGKKKSFDDFHDYCWIFSPKTCYLVSVYQIVQLGAY